MRISTMDFIRCASVVGVLAIVYSISVNGDDAGVLTVPFLLAICGILVPTLVEAVHDWHTEEDEEDRK